MCIPYQYSYIEGIHTVLFISHYINKAKLYNTLNIQLKYISLSFKV